MLRPSRRGWDSIVPISLTSSARRRSSSRPRSGWLCLATPEHDRDLDLRALVQEPLYVTLLGVVIVDADLRAELDLLHVDLALVLPSLLRLLLLLVLVLPVVHDLRDRRVGLGRHLDEVEVLAVGVLAGLVGGLDPELAPSSSIRRTLGTRMASLMRVVSRLRGRTCSIGRRLGLKGKSPSWAYSSSYSFTTQKSRCMQRPVSSSESATRLNPARRFAPGR